VQHNILSVEFSSARRREDAHQYTEMKEPKHRQEFCGLKILKETIRPDMQNTESMLEGTIL
jgi:hypothetical protein